MRSNAAAGRVPDVVESSSADVISHVHTSTSRRIWQARRESNPQPPVLETGALPIELLAYNGL